MEVLSLVLCILLSPLYLVSLGFSGGILIFSLPFVAMELALIFVRGLVSLVVAKLFYRPSKPVVKFHHKNSTIMSAQVASEALTLISEEREPRVIITAATSSDPARAMDFWTDTSPPHSAAMPSMAFGSNDLLSATRDTTSSKRHVDVKVQHALGSSNSFYRSSALDLQDMERSRGPITLMNMTAADLKDAANMLMQLEFDNAATYEPSSSPSHSIPKNLTPSSQHSLQKGKGPFSENHQPKTGSPMVNRRAVRASSAPVLVTVPSMMPYVGTFLMCME
ncbi:hypothetical protein BC829DRAFT_486178 [Chytridium lagenaria]|nr:hypothetical protein BC829DRAFT_486178 [Chytridium lagenaria]